MTARPAGPKLGRGLAALLGEVAPAVVRGGADGPQSIGVDLLEPGPHQPRATMNAEALDGLVQSIRSSGVLQPLLARPHPTRAGRFQIVAGERRWRAAQMAGLHELPVLVRALDDAEALAAALVENLQRQDLNAVEEAEGYRRLVEEFGLTQERLAVAVGKSRSHVANTLRLLHLPAIVQAEVRNGALSAGHARALLGHPHPERAALAVIAQGLNVRQTEALAAKLSNADERRLNSGPRDPNTVALERELSAKLGLKVRIDAEGRHGTLKLQFDTLDQLDGLVALLTR